jgi:hypothetical protein
MLITKAQSIEVLLSLRTKLRSDGKHFVMKGKFPRIIPLRDNHGLFRLSSIASCPRSYMPYFHIDTETWLHSREDTAFEKISS